MKEKKREISETKKEDDKEHIAELKKKHEDISKEIKEEITKQQEKIKETKKEKKLEEIVDEKTTIKKLPEEIFGGNEPYKPSEKNMSYEYMFSYLGSGVKKTFGEEYKEMISAKTSIAWSNERGDKDVMDIKEQQDYSIKQATNMILGTDMNHISHEEKIKFDAFMTDPSNKIIFLINYSLMGMNYRMPENTSTKIQYFEVKMTNQEITEKSMKNDRTISLRFEMKNSYAKEDVK